MSSAAPPVTDSGQITAEAQAKEERVRKMAEAAVKLTHAPSVDPPRKRSIEEHRKGVKPSSEAFKSAKDGVYFVSQDAATLELIWERFAFRYAKGFNQSNARSQTIDVGRATDKAASAKPATTPFASMMMLPKVKKYAKSAEPVSLQGGERHGL